MAKKPSLLSSVTVGQRIEILRKNWMSHEARWQIAVFQEFGWEKGNKINQAIAREMGKVAMYRLMKALGVSQVKNVEELEAVCLAARQVYQTPTSAVASPCVSAGMRLWAWKSKKNF